jgi:hypothetical protein
LFSRKIRVISDLKATKTNGRMTLMDFKDVYGILSLNALKEHADKCIDKDEEEPNQEKEPESLTRPMKYLLN